MRGNRRNKKGNEMTPAQKELFMVIESYWQKYGFAPSIDDIMYLTGAKGRGNICRKMKRLVELGVCKALKNRARTIRPSYMRVRDVE